MSHLFQAQRSILLLTGCAVATAVDDLAGLPAVAVAVLTVGSECYGAGVWSLEYSITFSSCQR